MPPKKPKSKSKSKKGAVELNKLPDDIIPQLVCQLKEISIVLLTLISPSYKDQHPTIGYIITLIKISIEILLNDNSNPILSKTFPEVKTINKYINTVKKQPIFLFIKPYLEEYKGEKLDEGIKVLYLFIQYILGYLQLFSANDGKSKEFSIKIVVFIGYSLVCIVQSIYNIPVFKFTGSVGSSLFSFFYPAPSSSCGDSKSSFSWHPSSLIESIVGNDPCSTYDDEYSQSLCKQYYILEKTDLKTHFKELIDYETEDRSVAIKGISNIMQSQFKPAGDTGDLIKIGLENLDTLHICDLIKSKNDEGVEITTPTLYECILEPKKIDLTKIDPINESSPNELSSSTKSSTSVDTSSQPPRMVDGGGLSEYHQQAIYGGFNDSSFFSNSDIPKHMIYNNINHFIDIHSLKGIYTLHQYNAYLHSN